jgi:mannose-6-phosphate isomerase-like protein (cupin superfamily)
MAHVCYEATHLNEQETGDRRGHGKDHVKWICPEEPGTRESLFSTCMELMMDARLDPHAAVGLHWHLDTEEIYYLPEGSLTMTTARPDRASHTARLHPGDAHIVKLGQGHYGVAGIEGARFIAVTTRRASA